MHSISTCARSSISATTWTAVIAGKLRPITARYTCPISAINSLLPLLAAETGLNQLTSLLRTVTRRRGEAAELVKAGLADLKAVEAAAQRLGLVVEVQYSARSLYPPSQYSGLTLQLVRVMPGRRNSSPQVDIVAAGGRYDLLVERQDASLTCKQNCAFLYFFLK